MSEQKYSRRDWFRLKPSRSEVLGDSQSETLRAIEAPPNHDGMDLTELPPLREAWLSEDQVRELFADLERFASDVRLVAKTQTGHDQSLVLKTACAQLLWGQVARLQIRYCWDASQWIDTLERRTETFRLVRIRHAAPG